eukprot:3937370-Rhodomonas_salina.3
MAVNSGTTMISVMVGAKTPMNELSSSINSVLAHALCSMSHWYADCWSASQHPIFRCTAYSSMTTEGDTKARSSVLYVVKGVPSASDNTCIHTYTHTSSQYIAEHH